MKSICIRKLLVLVFIILLIPRLNAQKIYAVIVAQNDDPKIGESVTKDVSNWHQMLYMIGAATGYKIAWRVYRSQWKKYYTGFHVMRIIKSFEMTDNDIFIFLYSGHGSASPGNSELPRIYLSGANDYLDVQSVQDYIETQPHHLSIVMADACNSYLDIKGASKAAVYFNKPILSDKRKETIRNLFLNRKGEITITSSKKGTTSYGYYNGGAYTNSFLNAFYSALDDDPSKVSWKKILDKSSSVSYNAVQRTPHYEIDVSRVVTNERIVRDVYFYNNCNIDIELMIKYLHENGDWVFESSWRFNAKKGAFLLSGNERIRTSNRKICFFAETVNPTGWVWEGDHEVYRKGENIKMLVRDMKVDVDGDYVLKVTCPNLNKGL